MKSFKDNLLAGLFSTIPLLIFSFLLLRFIGALKDLMAPLGSYLPEAKIMGLGTAEVLAVIVFLVLSYILGFLIRNYISPGYIERLQFFIPGYKVLTTLLSEKVASKDRQIESCLATVDDAWLYGFIIEKHEDGMYTVFVPAAPSVTSGTLYFMREDQVKHLDIPKKELAKMIIQLGMGSAQLLKGKVKW